MSFVEILFIGTIAMFMMGIFVVTLVILQQKQVIKHKFELKDKDILLQKERLRSALKGQESERKRISEDLHDEVGAQLSVLKLNLNYLQQNAQPSQVDRIKETKEFTDTIIQHLRFISQSLHPQALENLGLDHALDSFCSLMNKNKSIKISYGSAGNEYQVDKEVALNVYRVVQELINNIMKHAEAQLVRIEYVASANGLIIKIEDDGNGLLVASFENSRQQQGSLGLKNIESRLNIIGGNINFVRKSPKGTIATVTVPNFQPTK